MLIYFDFRLWPLPFFLLYPSLSGSRASMLTGAFLDLSGAGLRILLVMLFSFSDSLCRAARSARGAMTLGFLTTFTGSSGSLLSNLIKSTEPHGRQENA